MKFRNFTGQIPNFCGGFSGGTSVITETPGTLWQLGTYNYRGSLQTGAETAPLGLWFKPDGTKLFVIGETADRIRSWDLTTAWDITTATNLYAMTTTLFDTGGTVALNAPSGVAFSDNGFYAFVPDRTVNTLFRFNLGTAWDLSTINATASQANSTVYTGNLAPASIWLKPDGLTFATVNTSTTNGWQVYTSTVANDITTLTRTSFLSAASGPIGGVFVDNGNRWVSLRQSTDLLEMSNVLATPYVLAGWTSNNTRVMTTQDTTPQDVYMTNDGTRFYYVGSASDSIYQFTL